MIAISSSCVIWLRIESTRFSTSVFDGVACARQNCATKRRTIPTANLRLLIVVGSITRNNNNNEDDAPARTRCASQNLIELWHYKRAANRQAQFRKDYLPKRTSHLRSLRPEYPSSQPSFSI